MGDRRMSPLSPSIPPITPLKRAAHWGLTPPAAPGFPRGWDGLINGESRTASSLGAILFASPGGLIGGGATPGAASPHSGRLEGVGVVWRGLGGTMRRVPPDPSIKKLLG